MALQQIKKQLTTVVTAMLVLGISTTAHSPALAETPSGDSWSPPSVEPQPPDVEPPQLPTPNPSAPDPEDTKAATPSAPPTEVPNETPPISSSGQTPAPPNPAPQPTAPAITPGPGDLPPQIDSGGLVYDSVTGQQSFASAAGVVGNGFAISGNIRYNNGTYVLKLVNSPGIGILRPSVVEALNNINQTGTVSIALAGGTIPARPAVDVRGELYLEVTTISPCGTNWAGCGAATSGREDGLVKAVSGRTWIHPLVFNYDPAIRRHVIIHELGHALGLSHFDGQYLGQWQLMNKGRYDSLWLAAGDVAGLNYLRHPRPTGSFDAAVGGNGQFTVSGWALDGVHNGAVSVHVYVSGVMKAAFPANKSRPDVNQVYRRGPNHGFVGTVTHPPGRYTVCTYAKHNTSAMSTPLGCKIVTVGSSNKTPIGSVDAAKGGVGTVSVSGWTLDPDATAPIAVHVYIDGRYSGASTAKGSRPDVDRVYQMGAAHGYSLTMKANPGSRAVCVYAINTPIGPNPPLGCRQVGVASNTGPIGSLDSVTLQSRAVLVRGWTLDQNTTAPISVHVYVNGRFTTAVTANGNRPDVERVYRKGALHGYSVTIPLTPGPHQVCVYAINIPVGTNPLLGCAARTVPK